MLVHTDISPKEDLPRGTFPCGSPGCKLCPWIDTNPLVISTTNNYKFRIRGHHTCKSSGVVYILTCAKCSIQYIGESGNTIMERMRGHRADIRNLNGDKPVSNHVRITKHVPFGVRVLTSGLRDINKRLRTEEAFIRTMATKEPQGLNRR